jgi:drug/metabolite transporter (DMT)-like permease
MKKSTVAWATLLLTTVLWASSLIFAKIVFTEVTPFIFVALRYTIAAPFLVILVLTSRNRSDNLKQVRINWKVILIAGISGPFLSQVLQYLGLGVTTAGETLLLLSLSPVFAVILASPILNEKITMDKIAGLTIATLGVSFIVIGGTPIDAGFGLLRVVGDLIIIVSTFLFAVNGIAGKIAMRSVDSVSVTTFSTIAAVPFIWISVAIFEDFSILLQLSLTTWLIVLWVGTINTVLGFILYYESMKYIEASRVQIALNMVSVWGVLMSVLILSEPTSILQLLGGALTIIGVIVAQRYANDHKPSENEPIIDS